MAAHRYWRINIATTYASYVTITQIRMYEDPATGWVNQSVSGNGTPTDSNHFSGSYLPDYAFDESGANWWYSEVLPNWIKWDFGASNDQDITHITVAATGDGAPNSANLEYSDDDSAWTVSQAIHFTSAGGTTMFGPATSMSAAITMPMATVSAFTGSQTNAVMPLPTVAMYGGATANLTMPMPTVTGRLDKSLHITAAMPMPTVYMTAHDSSDENGLAVVMPMATVEAYGGANATAAMPMPTVEMTGTGTALLSAAVTMPMPTVESSVTAGGVISADLTLTDMFTVAGYFGGVCDVTIDGFTVEASGTSGGVMSAAVTCPLFELVATVSRDNTITADLIMPMPGLAATGAIWAVMPMAQLVFIGTATVTATYEAYAINLKHTSDKAPDEVTRYTNFPFTHIVRYQNSYFGANENGLFLLEGTTDYAATPTAIPWAFKTAVTDFGYPEFKTIESAYIGGRLGPSETLTLYAGEGAQTQAYSYTTPRGELAQNYRQKFGKGIKNHRYYAMGANGSGELVIDSIDFNVAKLSRRI